MRTINNTAFKEFPVLTTKRLLLRRISPQDAEKIYEMRSNDRVNQFIARDSMENIDSAEALVEKTLYAYENSTGIAWVGVLKDMDEIIGSCGFNDIDLQNLRAELGGELFVKYWGRNLAIEAVDAIVNFGFNTMQLHSIETKVNPENRGAIYLLEQLGFENEGYFKDRIYWNDRFFDLAVYSLINPG